MQDQYNKLLNDAKMQQDFFRNIDKLIEHAKKYGFRQEALRLIRGRQMVADDIALL